MTASAGTRPFTKGLRHHGWIEGQNLTIEYRWAEGRYERLPDLAADLARLPLDAIFAVNTPTALAMQRTGTTRPVVFAIVSEPVEIGLVESLPQPQEELHRAHHNQSGADGQCLKAQETTPLYARTSNQLLTPQHTKPPHRPTPSPTPPQTTPPSTAHHNPPTTRHQARDPASPAEHVVVWVAGPSPCDSFIYNTSPV